MSTYKFHINDSKAGHDLESRTLMKMGFGDVLNKRNQTEKCIDTVSMYKKASSGALVSSLTGGTLGALGGYELAGAYTGSATTKLISAILGGAGGALIGHAIGDSLDTKNKLNVSAWNSNPKLYTSIAMGLTGGALGYAANKYVFDNRGPISHTTAIVLGTLAGAISGGFLGGKPNSLRGQDPNNYTVKEDDSGKIMAMRKPPQEVPDNEARKVLDHLTTP